MAGRRSAVLSLIAVAVIARTSAAQLHPVEAELRRSFASVSLDSKAKFEAADAFVSGRLTSGLRARFAAPPQPATLRVLYPRSYDGMLAAEVGSQRVVLRAIGARGAPVTESSGRLVYTRPYASTDVVEVPNSGRSEELLLLHDEQAPLVYEYEIVATDGVAAVALHDGAIRFLRRLDSTDSLPALQIDRPWVIDASGKRTESQARWTLIGDGAIPKAIRLSVTRQGVVFPLLVDPSFSLTGGMSTGRLGHTATLLANGKVLIAGGANESSAEIYDAFSGTFTATGSMSIARLWHTATLLRNGKVLIVGGWDTNTSYFASAELYDPDSGAFTSTGSLANARFYHTATLLADGKVLIAGGRNSTGYLTSAELYDPVSGTFSPTGTLATARNQHTATLLPNGKVLFAGGYNGTDLTSGELYDPASGTFTSTGSLAIAREDHTATLLPNGKVLIAGGGVGGVIPPIHVSLTSAELYDPANETFSSTGSLATQRNSHTATLLPNGTVLIAGGYDGTNSLTSAEVYDSATGTFSATGAALRRRAYHTATLLPNGKVLIAGGSPVAVFLGSVELYDPASGTFSTTSGSLATARKSHTATLLLNGKVLIVGGVRFSAYLTSAELYDPASGTFSATGSLANGRASHTATLLPDGRVLVAGGYNGTTFLTSAEVYDPSTGTFSATTSSLANARYQHTATLLADGKVLIAGGFDGGNLTSAEVYDPSNGTFSATTGSLVTARENHTATLLPDGKVLIAGGSNGAELSSAELYDPSSRTFSVTSGSLANARTFHTATLLPQGNVLIAGGVGVSSVPAAELYDPANGTFSAIGNLVAPRYQHTATLLPNGDVLIAGGRGSTGYLTSAELYDPVSGTFSPTGTLATARNQHTATLLPNGKVLFTGGSTSNIQVPFLSSAELYDAGLGFAQSRRPVVTSAPATLNLPATLTLLGNGFLGDSEASSGGTNSSQTNYPIVQLERIDNEQTFVVKTNSDLADTTWSGFLRDLAVGPYRATIFTNGIPSTQQLVQILPATPTITKAFGAASIPLTGTTTLTFSLTNPNGSTSLSGVSFTDNFPSGLAVATPNGLSGSCVGGTITATAGSSSVSLSGATLAASAACNFTVNVTGTQSGLQNNFTSAVTSNESGAGGIALASVVVVAPPTIAKVFGASSVALNGSTTLTFTLSNPNTTTTLHGVGFTDGFPAGLAVANPNSLTGSCGGGTIGAPAGATSVSLSGATIDASGSCTFSVSVIGITVGHQVNTTGNVASTNGGAGNTATASIDIVSSDLTITKTHSGNFTQGQKGQTYSIVITNIGNASSSGTVSVSDTLPAGLTAVAMSGTGWTCNFGTLTCTRSDALTASSSYSPITLAVNVASNAAANVTNIGRVSGGGEINTANNTATDPTIVNAAALIAPTNLIATADSAVQVTIRWDAVAAAAKYQVYRTHDNMPLSGLGAAITATSVIDSTIAANTTYVYMVEAVDGSNNLSPPSNLDIATTIVFTDNPVVAGSTLIKAAHVIELRTAVNAMLAATGQGPMTFTDPSPAGIFIKAVHITELRTNLNTARASIGLPAIAYSDPGLSAGSAVKAAHVQELRDGVK